MPIILPTASDESTCPSCNKPEDIKEVCRHCGHEYKEPEITGTDVLIIIALIFAALAIFGSILFPIMNWLTDDHSTLVQEFVKMFKFWWHLVSRIW